jgi:hypothetical protein
MQNLRTGIFSYLNKFIESTQLDKSNLLT